MLFGSLRVKKDTSHITHLTCQIAFYYRMLCVLNLHVQAKRHHYYQ
jgi:hypothetical protein